MSAPPPRRFRIAPHAHARRLDDELVVLDLAKGEYFGLNDVGADLWEGLEKGTPVAEILDGLRARYEVDAARLAADIDDLLVELARRGLVVPE